MTNKTVLIRFKDKKQAYNMNVDYLSEYDKGEYGYIGELNAIYKPLPNHKYIDGYNKKKYPTMWKVRINSRYYRIYSDCFSNVSSCYIIVNKQKFFIM